MSILPKVESRTQGSRPRPRTDLLEAKAKDQGHRRKCSPKKKVLKIFFRRSQKKRSSKKFFRRKKSSKLFFFQAISTWGNQKKVFADFPLGLPTKFQRFQNSAVFEPRTGQFSRTWGFEAKDFKMCPRGRPRGQGRSRGLLLRFLLTRFYMYQSVLQKFQLKALNIIVV